MSSAALALLKPDTGVLPLLVKTKGLGSVDPSGFVLVFCGIAFNCATASADNGTVLSVGFGIVTGNDPYRALVQRAGLARPTSVDTPGLRFPEQIEVVSLHASDFLAALARQQAKPKERPERIVKVFGRLPDRGNFGCGKGPLTASFLADPIGQLSGG
jgi:hypothetical protein